MNNKIKMLPNEVLEIILSRLPLRDLCTAMLVCRKWRDIGDAPKLWSSLQLTVDTENLSSIPKALSSNRLSKITYMDLNVVSKDLLQAIQEHSMVKEIHIRARMSSIEPTILFNTVTNMESIRIPFDDLTMEQVESILKAICGDSKMKCLSLGSSKISSVDPNLLSIALNKLVEVTIRYLTPEQTESLITGLCGDTKLKYLEIGMSHVFVNSRMLARAVSKLERLRGIIFTQEQIKLVLAAICEGASQLKHLDFEKINLFSLDPQLLAKAVTKLQSVTMALNQLSRGHVEAIFASMNQVTQLTKLWIQRNNLSSVDSEVFAKVINKMEDVNLVKTSLSSEQVTQILRQSLKQTKLRRLIMNKVDNIDEEIIVLAKEKYVLLLL